VENLGGLGQLQTIPRAQHDQTASSHAALQRLKLFKFQPKYPPQLAQNQAHSSQAQCIQIINRCVCGTVCRSDLWHVETLTKAGNLREGQPIMSAIYFGSRMLASVAVCSMLTFTPTTASAASMAVEMACATDYFTHCSKHDPDSPGVRSCMRAVGSRLSPRCIKALSAAGEIPSSRSERRASR